MLVFRFANPGFEPIWNHHYIDHVQITAAEAEGIGTIIINMEKYDNVPVFMAATPDFIEKNPKIVKATVDSLFEALDMIKREPDKAYEMMGSVVKQPGDAFAKSAAYIAWQDRTARPAKTGRTRRNSGERHAG